MKTRMMLVMSMALVTLIGCGGGSEPASPAAPAASKPAAADAPATGSGAATGTAMISGKVSFSGTAPKRAKIQMSADPVCVTNHPDPAFTETVIVNDNGTLRNVFVYVNSGLEGKSYPVPSEPVVMDQKGCTYTPHVFGVRAGQPIKILNSDGTLHNVHAFCKNNPGFNLAMPKFLKEKIQTFENPETMVKFQCEVHNWMSAWAGVMAHPFFSVTGDDGSFSLEGLPAGTYEVVAWHEKYGTKSQKVTVADDGSETVEFSFSAS